MLLMTTCHRHPQTWLRGKKGHYQSGLFWPVEIFKKIICGIYFFKLVFIFVFVHIGQIKKPSEASCCCVMNPGTVSESLCVRVCEKKKKQHSTPYYVKGVLKTYNWRTDEIMKNI